MTDWVEQFDEAIDFIENADHRAQILLRFESQYLPALRNAKDKQQVWRAWEAFRFYLMARATNRKPFVLLDEEADRLIATAVELLDLPPHAAP